MAHTRSHTSRSRPGIWDAISTARACTNGCSRQSARGSSTSGGEHSGALALTPAPEKRQDDIRKFEEIGTHPAANHNAIAEALTFHEGIGSERKAASSLSTRPLGRTARPQDKVRIHTNLKPEQSCAIGTVQIVGVPTPKVIEQLWARWRIIATPIVHAEYEGARVTPNIYTTLEEIDTFAAGMEEIARKGVAG